jgi:hypothetical protein
MKPPIFVDLILFAERSGGSMDPTIGFGSVMTVIGNLGQAGGALVAVWFFLNFWQKESVQREKINTDRDKRYEELIGRLNEVIERQNGVLQDNYAALREFSRSAVSICRAINPTEAARRVQKPGNRGDKE